MIEHMQPASASSAGARTVTAGSILALLSEESQQRPAQGTIAAVRLTFPGNATDALIAVVAASREVDPDHPKPWAVMAALRHVPSAVQDRFNEEWSRDEPDVAGEVSRVLGVLAADDSIAALRMEAPSPAASGLIRSFANAKVRADLSTLVATTPVNAAAPGHMRPEAISTTRNPTP